jgi:hypothetical protein
MATGANASLKLMRCTPLVRSVGRPSAEYPTHMILVSRDAACGVLGGEWQTVADPWGRKDASAKMLQLTERLMPGTSVPSPVLPA